MGQAAKQVGRFEDDGCAANAGAYRNFFFGRNAVIYQGAEGLGQTEGADAADGVAGDLEHFFFIGGCQAALAQVLAQGGPGDLFGAGDKEHHVVAFVDPE